MVWGLPGGVGGWLEDRKGENWVNCNSINNTIKNKKEKERKKKEKGVADLSSAVITRTQQGTWSMYLVSIPGT